jgi:starch synthase
MSGLRVLSVASEVYPLVKTGGLGDVVAALPPALAAEGVTVRTLVPGYSAVLAALRDAETVHTFANLYGAPARLLAAHAAGLALDVLDAPRLFVRPGTPYADAAGAPWPDNAFRFAALSAAAAAIARGAVPDFVPDVVQAHDWQAGLVPAFLHYGEGTRPATVMTIQNLAFQGQFPREWLAALALPPRAYAMDGVEYYGTIGYLKAGIALADRITTVSPTYAAEIRTQEGGMGMDGLLRENFYFAGEFTDTAVFTLLRREFPSAAPGPARP